MAGVFTDSCFHVMRLDHISSIRKNINVVIIPEQIFAYYCIDITWMYKRFMV